MFFCEWRRAYPRMQGAIHGKTAQKNNADCLEFFQLSTSVLLIRFAPQELSLIHI